VTPELRAARDRLLAYFDARRSLFGTRTPDVLDGLTLRDQPRTEVRESDVRTVLAALDRYEAMDEAVRQDVRQVAAEAGFDVNAGRDITVTWSAPAAPTAEEIEDLKRNFLAAVRTATQPRVIHVDNRESTFTPHEPQTPYYPESSDLSREDTP